LKDLRYKYPLFKAFEIYPPISIIKPDLLQEIKHIDMVGKWKYCDIPFPERLIDIIVGQLGFPYHINLLKSKRMSYIAKQTRMYVDIFVMDKGRYLYDFFPFADMCSNFLNGLKNMSISNQIIIAIILDSFIRHMRYIYGNLFSDSFVNPIESNDPLFDEYYMSPRDFIKLEECCENTENTNDENKKVDQASRIPKDQYYSNRPLKVLNEVPEEQWNSLPEQVLSNLNIFEKDGYEILWIRETEPVEICFGEMENIDLDKHDFIIGLEKLNLNTNDNIHPYRVYCYNGNRPDCSETGTVFFDQTEKWRLNM
jgi:hypothetical protein